MMRGRCEADLSGGSECPGIFTSSSKNNLALLCVEFPRLEEDNIGRPLPEVRTWSVIGTDI